MADQSDAHDRIDHSRFTLVPASYLYLRRGNRVLLQQRANTGYMDGCWVAGAAGHLERGETAAQAAVREAAEELGVVVTRDNLRFLTVMQRTDGSALPREQRVDWFWTAADWAGLPEIAEPGKCMGLAWYDLGDLPGEIPDYERFVLERWRDRTLPASTAHGFTHT